MNEARVMKRQVKKQTMTTVLLSHKMLTYIWENLKRASMLMLRSNTFMMKSGTEI